MSQTIHDLITDEQIDKAWGYANFGEHTKREVIQNALLKYACGYGTGHTIFCICRELGLITNHSNLTTLGKQYLYQSVSKGVSV